MGSVRGFRVECQVREAGGFFGGHTYAAARVTLERGRDEIKYLQCTKLSPGDGEGTCTSGETQQGSVRLPLAGMKLKVQKGLVACCSYSKTKDEARTATHFKFDSEDVLRSFLGEMASFPEIFRRFRDYYEVGEKVGEGHTCVVYKAKSKIDGGVYAIKLSTKSKESHKEMHNELRILRYLRNEHPALPRVNDYFYDSKGNIAIVLEFLDLSLGEYVQEMGSIPEPQARAMFKGVLDCVCFLHRKGLAHRDLKVENLMFVPTEGVEAVEKHGGRRSFFNGFRSNSRKDEEARARRRRASSDRGSSLEALSLKVIDFGFGKIRSSNCWKASTPCGTTRYMAPEMVEGRAYCQAVDLWSLGCILHYMLFGKLPFSKDQVKQGDVSQPCLGGDEISQAAKDLLSKLLSANTDKNRRVTASEAAEHPWFTAAEEFKVDEVKPASDLPLSRGSLSPGENLGKMLSRMREAEEAREGDGTGEDPFARPSPVTTLNFVGDSSFKSRQLSILRMHLEEQLGPAGNRDELSLSDSD